MANTRSSSAGAGIVEGVGLLVLALALVGCRGHTGGMTPGRGLARAAGAIATVAAATVASAATRDRRERRSGQSWSDPGEPLGPFPRRGDDGLGDAPQRLVRMPSGDAALAPEQITCTRSNECVAIAGDACHPIAVRAEVAAELGRPECEPPGEEYVPRCVYDLCRLESLAPEQAREPAPPRARPADELRDDELRDDELRDDDVPPPPPGYEPHDGA